MAKIDSWGTVHGGQVLLGNQYMVLNVNNYHLENTITVIFIKVSFLKTKEKKVEGMIQITYL